MMHQENVARVSRRAYDQAISNITILQMLGVLSQEELETVTQTLRDMTRGKI
jgi:hypothetical protein